MEIKRQAEAAANDAAADAPPSRPAGQHQGQLQPQQLQQQQHQQVSMVAASVAAPAAQESRDSCQKPARRVRGRRSSKPMMEKRRRARINQCMDILKFYVLNDTSNLSRLGIDVTTRENHNEETIARTILKTSGLINRHRGRKNPNKLEKADILELTVDYVRRLHEQREELIQRGQGALFQRGSASEPKQQRQQQQQQQPTAQLPLLTSPLTLTLPTVGLQSTPPTPPSSSASSSPQPLLSISSNIQHPAHSTLIPHATLTSTSLPDVLDLSDSKRARAQQFEQQQQVFVPLLKRNC